MVLGRAVAQAVSRRLPTVEARVWARVRSRRICGGQSGIGAGFLRVLRFPLLSIPPISPHSSSSIIIRGWYSRPNSGLSNSGLGSTPPQETTRKTMVLLVLQSFSYRYNAQLFSATLYCAEILQKYYCHSKWSLQFRCISVSFALHGKDRRVAQCVGIVPARFQISLSCKVWTLGASLLHCEQEDYTGEKLICHIPVR
jgi:hypothetical protein